METHFNETCAVDSHCDEMCAAEAHRDEMFAVSHMRREVCGGGMLIPETRTDITLRVETHGLTVFRDNTYHW